MGNVLSKEQILSVDDRKTEVVSVPEWGGDVIVRSLTAKEKEEWENSLTDVDVKNSKVKLKVNYGTIMARLVALTVIDGAGNLLFTHSDITRLSEKSGVAVDRVCAVAKRLGGITDQDLEELEKNSESDLSDSSASD